HKDQTHADPLLKTARTFDPKKLFVTTQTTPASLICLSDPVRTNDGNEHFTRTYGLMDRIDEVHTRLDIGDVAEALLSAELCDQLVGDPTAIAGALAMPAVADKNLGTSCLPPT